LKLAAANIPFENSSTAFGALHPYGQSNILEIVNTTILVRKSTEKVFEQHRSVFFHKSSCILAIYKDIYIELTKISTAITTQKLKAAGITKHITFHCFRHTFATLQLAAGTDIYTISKLLTHSDVTTTQVYTDVVSSLKRDATNKISLK
jgi:site-specific recombinase XerD